MLTAPAFFSLLLVRLLSWLHLHHRWVSVASLSAAVACSFSWALSTPDFFFKCRSSSVNRWCSGWCDTGYATQWWLDHHRVSLASFWSAAPWLGTPDGVMVYHQLTASVWPYQIVVERPQSASRAPSWCPAMNAAVFLSENSSANFFRSAALFRTDWSIISTLFHLVGTAVFSVVSSLACMRDLFTCATISLHT